MATLILQSSLNLGMGDSINWMKCGYIGTIAEKKILKLFEGKYMKGYDIMAEQRSVKCHHLYFGTVQDFECLLHSRTGKHIWYPLLSLQLSKTLNRLHSSGNYAQPHLDYFVPPLSICMIWKKKPESRFPMPGNSSSHIYCSVQRLSTNTKHSPFEPMIRRCISTYL